LFYFLVNCHPEPARERNEGAQSKDLLFIDPYQLRRPAFPITINVSYD